jgi:S-methylmethionine-dependent homocysteine/selenocysteine methylase/SAM-dependent methyltransferase
MSDVRPLVGYSAVEAALAAGRCVILDGGIATELPGLRARALDAAEERLWGTRAVLDQPDAVRAVHRRYVDAGCDVVTTNTWGLASALSDSSWNVHWMDVARRAVHLAREADAPAVAFSLNGDVDRPEGRETIRLLGRAFATDPPDLLLVETLSLVRPSLFETAAALLETGLPVWMSFRRCRHGACGVYGQHWGGPEGDAFGRAARRLEELGVAALLVNCIPPDHLDGMVSYLRDFCDLPLGVYPNLGYLTNEGWRSESGVGGDEYAAMALRWRAEGAQIVGGCCGVGPQHIAAASARLQGTAAGDSRRGEAVAEPDPPERAPVPNWVDRRGRSLYPLPFPRLERHDGVMAPLPSSLLAWRYLFDEGIGAHQRCLDVGSGTGIFTVQLALNGAAHVHAIDVDERAVANTLQNAFSNGVADRVTAEAVDLYPWIPQERYEVVVASLCQTPVDPFEQVSGHRPRDYWGRAALDQLIAKLPAALAPEGRAYLVHISLVSQEQTLHALAHAGLVADVVDYQLHPFHSELEASRAQIERVEQISDAHHHRVGDGDLLAAYLLEVRHA